MTIHNAINHQLLFPLRSFVAAKPLASINNVLSQPASQLLGYPSTGAIIRQVRVQEVCAGLYRLAAEPDPRVLTK